MRNARAKKIRKKNSIIKVLLSLGLSILTAGVGFVFIQFLQLNLSLTLLSEFLTGNIPLVMLNVFVLWVVQLPLIFLLGNTIKSSFIFIFIVASLGIGNYQKMLYRPEPIYPSDILMLKDIKFLLFSVERPVQVLAVVLVAAFLTALFFLSKSAYIKKANIINNVYLKFVLFILSLSLFIPLVSFNKPDNIVK